VAWLAPLFVMFVLGVVHVALKDPPRRQVFQPPPFPPPALRFINQPLELEALLDSTAPLIPPAPDEVACLLEEAQALESSASALDELPPGRLTPGVRTLLRQNMVADLTALNRAQHLYRRCELVAGSPELARDLASVQEWVRLKRKLLIDLWVAKGPD
jgi:hypothetical protein